MQPPQSRICRHGPPKGERRRRVRQLRRLKNQKDGLAFNANVTGIGEGRKQRPKMGFMVGTAWICLLDQNAVWLTVPNAAPGCVSPAEAEWKVRIAGLKHFDKGTL